VDRGQLWDRRKQTLHVRPAQLRERAGPSIWLSGILIRRISHTERWAVHFRVISQDLYLYRVNSSIQANIPSELASRPGKGCEEG
jgi:hypothetical protein